MKITAGPVHTEQVDRPQARPVLVMPFWVRHKNIVQLTQQQAHDEMCRMRMFSELMRTAEGKDRIDQDEEMRQARGHVSKWTRVTATTSQERQRMRTSTWKRHKAENRAQTRVAAAIRHRGEAERPAWCEQQFDFACEAEQQCSKCRRKARRSADGPTGREVSTDNRERSGSMQSEQQGPAEPLEKKHKGSASTTFATERLEKRQKSNDIGMDDDIVTVPGGQQVHNSRNSRVRR